MHPTLMDPYVCHHIHLVSAINDPSQKKSFSNDLSGLPFSILLLG